MDGHDMIDLALRVAGLLGAAYLLLFGTKIIAAIAYDDVVRDQPRVHGCLRVIAVVLVAAALAGAGMIVS